MEQSNNYFHFSYYGTESVIKLCYTLYYHKQLRSRYLMFIIVDLHIILLCQLLLNFNHTNNYDGTNCMYTLYCKDDTTQITLKCAAHCITIDCIMCMAWSRVN